jgi:hypothetical protein
VWSDVTVVDITPGQICASAGLGVVPNGELHGFGFQVGNFDTTSLSTTSYGSTIAVFGAGSAYFLGRDTVNDIEFIMGASTSGYSIIGTLTDHAVAFRTHNVTRLYVDTSGNVGINYTGGTHKLSVNGTAALGDGGTTNYAAITANGNISFAGTAGFYPRFLTQTDEPAAGTGATQCDTSELVVWKDSDDSKVYICFNDGGTVKTVELA